MVDALPEEGISALLNAKRQKKLGNFRRDAYFYEARKTWVSRVS